MKHRNGNFIHHQMLQMLQKLQRVTNVTNVTRFFFSGAKSQNTTNMDKSTAYPVYYRRAGKIIKVVSPVQARVIILPPDVAVAERFTSTYPSEARLKEELEGMQLVQEPTWRAFLDTFYSDVVDERQAFHRTWRQEIADLVKTNPEPVAS